MAEHAGPPLLYPVVLDVAQRPCLVVGGGEVAARKARSLLECAATVTVIAPELCRSMEELVPVLHAVARRSYRIGDAAGFRLVITATGRAEVDGTVHADGEAAGIWVNSADDRAHSSFILPAIHRDGPVTVAVSTSGRSPALASWLRSRLAADCDGVGSLALLLGDVRSRLQAAGTSTESIDWGSVIDGGLLELVRTGDLDGARARLEVALGL